MTANQIQTSFRIELINSILFVCIVFFLVRFHRVDFDECGSNRTECYTSGDELCEHTQYSSDVMRALDATRLTTASKATFNLQCEHCLSLSLAFNTHDYLSSMRMENDQEQRACWPNTTSCRFSISQNSQRRRMVSTILYYGLGGNIQSATVFDIEPLQSAVVSSVDVERFNETLAIEQQQHSQFLSILKLNCQNE